MYVGTHTCIELYVGTHTCIELHDMPSNVESATNINLATHVYTCNVFNWMRCGMVKFQWSRERERLIQRLISGLALYTQHRYGHNAITLLEFNANKNNVCFNAEWEITLLAKFLKAD